MSIVKSPNGNNDLSTDRRYDWQHEKTLVDQRQSLLNRVRRFFTFWRVVIVVIILAALFDAGVMRGIVQFFTTSGQAIVQTFAVDLSNIALILIRLFVGITIAIGQFALIFWFLGRARTYTIWPGSTSEGVSFKDYRGQPELLEQAKQIVTLLRGVRVFEESGGEPLNGLLLEGPPGTGKTWMAQAISTEAGVPFFYLDASSLMSMFFGIAPLKVMNLYGKARRAARDYGAAIIFIDEIDAIGSRGGVSTTNQDGFGEPPKPGNRLHIMFAPGGQMGMLSTLLTEMDGFSAEHGFWARKRTWFYRTILRRKPPKPQRRILTIGATNRIGALDPALLRAGRFDKKVRVDAPDMEGRRDIFAYYLSKMAHDESMDPIILASETPYYTPADIKYLLNEGLRYALFDGRTYITYNDFRLAQPEHEMGLRSPIKNLAPEDKYRLAAHEAGHAIAIRLYRPSYRISRITIIRQGGAHGHVSSYPALEEFDYMSTFEKLMNDLRVSVAGKAGEMEFAGENSQTFGVGGDFARIRFVLTQMANAGMFGQLLWDVSEDQQMPETMELMENTFRNVLEEVRLALRTHREMSEALIQLLIEKDELLAKEVEVFFDQYGLYTPKVQLPSEIVTAASVTGGQPA